MHSPPNETNALQISKLVEGNESDALETPVTKRRESTEMTDSIVVEVSSCSESHSSDMNI